MIEKLRIRSMGIGMPPPGGGADYSGIAAAAPLALQRVEKTLHAVAVERIARELDLAGRAHRDSQPGAAGQDRWHRAPRRRRPARRPRPPPNPSATTRRR